MLRPRPAGWSWQETAALPVAGLTAWRALVRYARAAAGKTILVTGGGGGVATFAVQIAAALGCRVLTTTSSPEKLDRLRELGAADGADYRDPEWPDRIGLVDAVIDSVGGAAWPGALRTLRPGGVLVCFGDTEGDVSEIVIADLFFRYLSVHGTTLGSPREFDVFLAHCAESAWRPVIDSIFTLADEHAAHRGWTRQTASARSCSPSTNRGSSLHQAMRIEDQASGRSAYFATRPISRDALVPEDPALGLVAFSSPFDPEPSLRIEDGRIVELDGRSEADFDILDEFIARRGIDLTVAEEAMALDTVELARMIVDPAVPRTEITRLVAGMTPAKLAATLALLTPVEILQAMQKMRVRKTPSIQAHVTNRVDHPLLIAADAAAAVALGFRELETTVPVLRDAPANALALLIGGQVGAAGALTQCSVEERTELELGMRGLTTYAETVSVYGTEQIFVDGDDTPWSKAFLASCYASRGLKMRFTSARAPRC
jgi:hypothetical protein